jgi:NAD(P)-dependent dehydrogenase (short-subunit alcohol dehydrogenase family)
MGCLAKRVALVTGAASGIGAACAQRFAREGAAIAGFDVAGSSGEPWRAIAEAAPKAHFWEVDVRDEGAVSAAVAAAAERFGRIDVLLNAAGVSGIGPVAELAAEEWDRVLDVNLKGTFLVCKHVVARMRAQGSGSIVNIASIEGIVGFPGQAAYNASKGGVILLTRNMAVDYGADGIRVNCLCPGLIDTPMTAVLHEAELAAVREEFVAMHLLRRAGRPEEVAGPALFLASDDAAFITGHTLVVDGGLTAGRRLLAGEALADG